MSGTKVIPGQTDQSKCPQCGTPLPTGALAGLCPACLLKMGAQADTVTDVKQTTFNPPSVAELAPLFPQLEILELIGKGGMGAVYKARQKQLDRIVALKILPPGIGDDPAFAERFAREAKALAKLNHPGIVTLYEFGAADAGSQTPDTRPESRLYFILMEYVDGMNLRQLLHAGRVSAREALAIVPQICDALQFAHDQGIVHRDIKPENILLDRRGRVKVADFGLAKIVGDPLTRSSDTLSLVGGEGRGEGAALTDAHKVMGTPQYMSPEQIQAPGEVDHRADIYALGVVFYQMLTGELPGKQLDPPSNKVSIDVRLDEVVLRALEKRPELRYQQASVLKTQLETIAANPPASFTTDAGIPGTYRGVDYRSKTTVGGVPLVHVTAGIDAATSLNWRRVIPGSMLVGLVVGALTLAIIAFTTFMIPSSFQATARIKVDRPIGTNTVTIPGVTGYDPYFVQTEMQIIQSQMVLDGVIASLNLNARWGTRYATGATLRSAETLQLLKGRLSISQVRNTTMFDISAFSEVPTETAELANAVAEHYVAIRNPQLNVQIVERAANPLHPARPNRVLNLFIGAIIAVGLGLLASVVTLLFLVARKSTSATVPPQPQSQEKKPSSSLPSFSFATAMTFALAALFGSLCEFFLGHVLGKWIVAAFIVAGTLSLVLAFVLRHHTDEKTQRLFRRVAAGCAFVAALVCLGFAQFILFALADKGGWNPDLEEAVVTILIWFGAVSLPVSYWRLTRGGSRWLGAASFAVFILGGLAVWSANENRIKTQRLEREAQRSLEREARKNAIETERIAKEAVSPDLPVAVAGQRERTVMEKWATNFNPGQVVSNESILRYKEELKAAIEQDKAEAQRNPFVVQGRVVDEQGNGLGGVTLNANCGVGTLMRTGTTESHADGSYELRFHHGFWSQSETNEPPPANVQAATIFPAKPGYFDANLGRQGDLLMGDRMPAPGENVGWKVDTNKLVLPNHPYELNFVLLPAAKITGRLHDGTGVPLTNWSVCLAGEKLPPSSSVYQQVHTDASGRFQLDDLPTNGRWWLTVSRRGEWKEFRSEEFTLPKPGVYEFEVDRVASNAAFGLKIRYKLAQDRNASDVASTRLLSPVSTKILRIGVKADDSLILAGEPYRLTELADKLKELATTEPAVAVTIRADSRASFRQLTEVMNACQAAGIKQVSAETISDHEGGSDTNSRADMLREAQLADAKAKLNELLLQYTEQHPQVVRLREQIKALENE